MKLEFDTKKVANTINKKMSMAVRKVALDGLRSLRRGSPVDTGRFKANWSTSINTMSKGTTEKTASSLNEQAKAIRGYNLGQTLFLHNNLEYAVSLEYGYSKQAPKGWIRNTAILMQRKLNKIKRLI